MSRLSRVAAIVSLTVMLILYVSTIVLLIDRPMHYDENEYLHASWMVSAGKRLYVDFYEDHPPHFFKFVSLVRPDATSLQEVDVRSWVHRARALCGFSGLVAMAAIALFAWRATRSSVAGAIAFAVLVAGPQMWARGLADIRSEPPTLAIFWLGALLIAWDDESTVRNALRHGVGVGLIALAAAWNPKWPLESLVIGFAFLGFVIRCSRASRRLPLIAFASATPFGVAAFIPIVTMTSISNYVFFNFTLKSKTYDSFARLGWMTRFFAAHPFWREMDAHVRPPFLITALLALTLALASRPVRVRITGGTPRAAILAAMLLGASLLEIRFVYPYPRLWAQYLVMAVCGAAVVYAILLHTLAALSPAQLFRGFPLREVISLAALLVATLGACAFMWRIDHVAIAGQSASSRYWARLIDVRQRVPPGQSVWMSPPRHPVTVPDASYYWYSFREAAPLAISYKSTHPEAPLPAISSRDLPPCQVASGRARDLSLIELSSWVADLDVCDCAESSVSSGRIRPSPHFGIFGMAETGAARTPVWFEDGAQIWSHLCSFRGFDGLDADFERLARRRAR
jgi:hypothetical protein